ncbi:MAG: recombinase family protein [Chloroflexi bacterium]|jgi:site-specific DNA recombinase|nr:recombinase family protein [Chloroflexota bacterium]
MNVAIYARVSTEMQAEDETPILGQVNECQSFAESRGWEVVATYKDEGFTGRNTDRPGFQQMLSDAQQKPSPFQKIIVWKGSRIARNVEDRLACQSILARRGIDIVSPNEPEFEGAIRALMIPLLAGIDEYESWRIGEDTLRGMKTLARQGYSPGGRPPRGYRIHRQVIGLKKSGEPHFRSVWEPDPEWEGKALRAFEMLVDGCSSEEIIQQTGVVRNRSSISTYFRNPTFIGERVFNVHRRKSGRGGPIVKVSLDDPDVIRVPEAHKAIIPRELFDKAQEVLNKRRPQPGQIRAKKNNYILSGLLWCEKHNCSITGTGNKERRYYACESFRRGGRKNSDCALLKKEALEKCVMDTLKDKIFTRDRIAEAINYLVETSKSESKQAQREAVTIKKKMDKIKSEIDNLVKAISDGLNSDHVIQGIEDREKSLAILKKQLEEVKRGGEKNNGGYAKMKVDEKMIEAVRAETLSVLDNEDPDKQKLFLSSYIDTIKIKEDSLQVKFTFREPSDNSQVMVAGVGFEPTTFGL